MLGSAARGGRKGSRVQSIRAKKEKKDIHRLCPPRDALEGPSPTPKTHDERTHHGGAHGGAGSEGGSHCLRFSLGGEEEGGGEEAKKERESVREKKKQRSLRLDFFSSFFSLEEDFFESFALLAPKLEKERERTSSEEAFRFLFLSRARTTGSCSPLSLSP